MRAPQGKQLGAAIIECLDVHKWFGTFHALRGCSLTVQEKEVVVIIGPSGSGKSTFLRCINRLEVHQRGTIRVNGVTLTDDVRHIDQIRREVGMVFQSFNLFPHLTVLDTTPPELVSVAAAAGFRTIGIRLTATPSAPLSWPLSVVQPATAPLLKHPCGVKP